MAFAPTLEDNRRYRAFKALSQLEDIEEFGEHAKAGMTLSSTRQFLCQPCVVG